MLIAGANGVVRMGRSVHELAFDIGVGLCGSKYDLECIISIM